MPHLRRPDALGAVALLALIAAACGGGGTPTPTLVPGPTAMPASIGSDAPPPRDLADLARRFRRADPPSEVTLPAYAAGDVEQFRVIMLPDDSEKEPSRRTVSATLRRVSDHAYFFVEDGAEVADAGLDNAVQTFEEEVWPAVTGAFGPPALGIDGDPRVAVLHADLGGAVAGYVSDEDAYPKEAVPDSNQREMVYLNLSVPPGSASYTRVLAHELQHVIHRRHDVDEETWVNEGLSEVAAGLVGGGQSFYNAFLDKPDTQLNGWALLDSSTAHYGGAALFFTYLLEQTGGDPEQLAAEPKNGFAGIDAFLESTGEMRDAVGLVADWAVANFLNESSGPYGYRERDVSAASTAEVAAAGEGEVRQFATDYLKVSADSIAGPATFTFEGETAAAATAAADGAEGAFWYSGRGDNMDSRLTREVDLSGAASATLTFRTWYDVERWYDYAYVAFSDDRGRSWTALPGDHTTTEDPLGVSYGPGYGGSSDGWVDERIDLSAYAGERILLRFEYITDDSSNASGWAVDSIAVPEAGFFDDAGSDAGGWQREGFRRVSEPLPQRFELRLITLGPAPAVERIGLDAANRAEVALDGLGIDYRTAVIAIIATTDGTLEPARYRYEVTSH